MGLLLKQKHWLIDWSCLSLLHCVYFNPKKRLHQQVRDSFASCTAIVNWWIDAEGRDDEGACSADSASPGPACIDAGDACMWYDASDVLQKVEERKERSGDVCTGHAEQDHLTIVTTGLFTRLHKWSHLFWLQHQGITHLWYLQLQPQDLRAVQLISPVVASTSRNHSPVISTTTTPRSPCSTPHASSTR